MTIPYYKDSTIFTFFILNPPCHSDKGLSQSALNIKELILSHPPFYIYEIDPDRCEPKTIFNQVISAALELCLSNFLLPCFLSKN